MHAILPYSSGIGREPVTEMKRSGIEVSPAPRAPIPHPHPPTFQERGAYTHGNF